MIQQKCEWRLAEDVFSPPQSGHHVFAVIDGRHADVDRVDRRIIDERKRVGDSLRAAALRYRLSTRQIPTEDASDLDSIDDPYENACSAPIAPAPRIPTLIFEEVMESSEKLMNGATARNSRQPADGPSRKPTPITKLTKLPAGLVEHCAAKCSRSLEDVFDHSQIRQ